MRPSTAPPPAVRTWPPRPLSAPVTRRGAPRGAEGLRVLWGLRLSFVPLARQDAVELVPGVDVELGEDLVQVVLDGARAHEEPGSDLGVGQAIAGQPGDLGLPGGELGAGIGG